MDVISLDENRVKILENTVKKLSTQKEVESLEKAREFLLQLKEICILGKKYILSAPQVLDFEKDEITMERCFGDNLEIILRQSPTHETGVEFTNALLEFFINNGFYWGDFAPRNILISDEKISIVDFERGLKEKIVSPQLYLAENVYEEYGAFLLPSERIFCVEDIFSSTDKSFISFDDISSKRVKMILNYLGFDKFAPLKSYLLAVKMIVINEEPYIKDNEIIYPLIELEDFIKKHGRQKYVEKIVGDYYVRKRNI